MKFYNLILLSTVFGDVAARRVGQPRTRAKAKAKKTVSLGKQHVSWSGSHGSQGKQHVWSGSHGFTRSAGSFNDGVKKGCEEAEQSWKDYGSACSNISAFHSHIDA
jgi:hypothetical protein